MGRAFTTYFNRRTNQLYNEVTIRCGDKSVRTKAVWDTGATRSCISTETATILSLVPYGQVRINTPSGMSDRNMYLVDLELPNSVVVKDLGVSDSEIGGQGVGVLVGMDVISLGDFAVSNFDGKTTFTFRIPSEQLIDYVAEYRDANVIGVPTNNNAEKAE